MSKEVNTMSKGTKSMRLLISIAAGSMLLATASASAQTKIAVVAGGPHPYFSQWGPATKDAARDFGAQAEYRVPQSWDLNQQNQLLESMAAQGFNAFLVFANDANGTNSTLKDLTDNGARTAAIAACTNDPTPAEFCVATESYSVAYQQTKKLIEAMGGKGNILHVAGALIDSATQLRVNGVKAAVAETNGAVKLIQTIADIDAQEAADRQINGYLAAHAKEVDGIVATAWIPAVVAATSLRSIGDKRIRMIAYNDDPIVVAAMRDGFVTGTVIQNPYGQVYVAAYILTKLNKGCTIRGDAAWTPSPQTKRFIGSGSAYLNLENIDKAVDLQKAQTKELITEVDAKILSCP
jgi:ribose transport system substrate-binding protein